MSQHQGQIIEYAIRKNGYNISDLARGLGVNRRSVYNYFGNYTVKSSIIHQIGSIIRYDFSKDFPEIFKAEDFKKTIVPQNAVPFIGAENEQQVYKEKYIALLEKYNALLIEQCAVA